MSSTSDMIRSHPEELRGVDPEVLAECIDACGACALTCTACADACLGEESVAELVHCIRTDLVCADVCAATGAVLSRRGVVGSAAVRALVEACLLACRACADDCEQHAGMHEHCRICAEACRRCEQACERLLAQL
ncbi:four-helix bundle copper-binding protein [Rathayibacter sp. VKM Ac-2805]|uniref:four-helix bundle copper-binding protein n=1 Tax=Rathayibacter sp. VKM Ac-2805 TaxID=2609258 RepID=UPI00131F7430|nr:four-helix bundle copper-binding protein [Rathayibacter sp. VKM Ac-2805]QHC72591.1 four-helix bundle copper-binding protein [Rathayibacter sp. VKM Ac-2805]